MRILERLGLHRPELRAWAMYDVATSAAQCTIMVAVYPIFFTSVAGSGLPDGVPERYWAISNSVGVALIAVLGPVLGAIADYSAAKKRFLALFMTVGALAAAGMFLIHHGQIVLATVLFILVSLGATGSYVFYESLLPHIAGRKDLDRVSTAGYALGYLGGGVLLAFNLALIMHPEMFGLPAGAGLSQEDATLPSRLAFVSVGVWWILFSIPLFRSVPEPVLRREPDELGDRRNPLAAAFIRLSETLRELRGFRNAFIMLVAFLIYNDGINTIQRMATVYGTELGIGRNSLITAILLVQFVGIPFSFLFGGIAAKMGTKRAIIAGLAVYLFISVFGYFMTTATHFYILALLVGTVQGGTQALSRSLFASMIPLHKSGEFFGFFSVFSKFAGIFGPLLFAYVQYTTGSMRNGILSTILFFIVGGVLLLFVNEADGARAAQAADADARPLVTR